MARSTSGNESEKENRIVELVKRAQAGDEEAFTLLHNEYRSYVYKVCWSILRDRDTAEDGTQNTFLSAWRKMSTFRFEAKFRSWITRVAFNECKMILRKRYLAEASLEEIFGDNKNHDGFLLTNKVGSEPGIHSDDGSHTGGVDLGRRDSNVESIPERLLLEKIISELPPGYRRIFKLKEIEGFEHKEIAAMLRVSEGNCKSQRHKAGERLREAIKKLLGPQAKPVLETS